MERALELFALLAIAHALADYPLQGDFLARAKNAFAPIPGVPWQWALGSHAAIHAGFVWLITGHWELMLGEFALHAWIDHCKCEASVGADPDAARSHFVADQLGHLACKGLWVLCSVWVLA